MQHTAQTVEIAWMQADGRLVEHEQGLRQRRT
jgi:hypothetical protein